MADASGRHGTDKCYTLIGADGKPYENLVPETLGGYRSRKIYGALDCPSALRALAAGGYARNRVFFQGRETASAAGCRPCGKCMKAEYRDWKRNPASRPAWSSEE